MKQTCMKIFILGSILSGCTHSPTKDLLTTDFLLQKDIKQITFQGDNERPRFSANGNRLIYASRGRGNQKNLQLYETDLIRNKERRVTFQDGDAFDASYISEMEMIYSSTTDEIKESPFLNRNPSKEFPPADIYMSDRFGSDILRVTNQPGYDGEAFLMPHPTKPSVIFTSRRGDVTGIYQSDLKSGFVSLLAAETGRDRRSPTLSPEKSRVAFIETNLETKQQSLQLVDIRTKQTVLLKSDEGQYRDLFFAPRPPARLFYSILRKGEKKNQIEVYNLETKCTQVVFKGTDSLMYPAVSNESNERVAFTRTFQDKKQIYIVALPDDMGPCLADPNAAKTEVPATANGVTSTDNAAAAAAVVAPTQAKPTRRAKRQPIPKPSPVQEPANPLPERKIVPESPTPSVAPTATPIESAAPSLAPAASPVSAETATPAPTPVK
ncbi:PD40 domain-containing protein [Bdellovibrio sp. KM01]|nr:PD40 domain-containing protein [Bdellovibrio sp. KM01]